VAQAVVDLLNTGVYSQSFVAARAYRVDMELQDSSALKVLVVPRGVAHILATRSGVQIDVQIDIGIQKKSALSNSALDSLMGLVEEILSSLRQPGLTFAGFMWVSTENSPIYSPDHLDQAKEFLSILTLTFRAVAVR
jgi:hypothetical protein